MLCTKRAIKFRRDGDENVGYGWTRCLPYLVLLWPIVESVESVPSEKGLSLNKVANILIGNLWHDEGATEVVVSSFIPARPEGMISWILKLSLRAEIEERLLDQWGPHYGEGSLLSSSLSSLCQHVDEEMRIASIVLVKFFLREENPIKARHNIFLSDEWCFILIHFYPQGMIKTLSKAGPILMSRVILIKTLCQDNFNWVSNKSGSLSWEIRMSTTRGRFIETQNLSHCNAWCGFEAQGTTANSNSVIKRRLRRFKITSSVVRF